jgi:hypothetical protein
METMAPSEEQRVGRQFTILFPEPRSTVAGLICYLNCDQQADNEEVQIEDIALLIVSKKIFADENVPL